ncbi:Cyclin G-associated kinase [Fasciola gigantica]|uniref:Cyclin G-associated kinase n=1 Tax=Fasciola gigantica TaxID=46835 RepID=A0A504YUX7_FASGI|nr:Cyclin G-associated kinase [Fasciola gigantica]
MTPARPVQPPPPVPTSPQEPTASVFTNTRVAVDSPRVETNTIPAFSPGAGSTSSGSMLGMLKGGAGSLFRNLRDASTKVIEQVSASLATDLDFQLITSRIAVMPYPSESGLETLGSSNSIEEVQAMLNARYPGAYAVYNLSTRTYRSDRWFDGRVSHRVFEPNRAPALRSLLELCLNARLWLSQKPENVCVIHCTDGRALSAILVCSLLCFCRLFDNVSPALQLFSSKRGNPHLSPSQTRYIDYVAQLAHGRIAAPHQRPLKLIKLTVTPVPTFNKSKNGCRPYVEVYEGKSRVLSTFADYEALKSYVLEDGKFELLLNGVSVMGDLTVVIYHCRSSFAGRNKIASVKIAQFQLYTGFLEPEQSELIYFKSDLDCLDTNSGFGSFTSRYAESFSVTLEFMVSPKERPRQGNNVVYPWEMMPGPDALRPNLCVSSDQELHALLADFGRFNIDRIGPKRVPSSRAKPASRTTPSSTGTSGSATPMPNLSTLLVEDLPGSRRQDLNTADVVDPTARCSDSDSPRPNVHSRPEKVTASIWTADELTPSVASSVEHSDPLLTPHPYVPTTPSHPTQPTHALGLTPSGSLLHMNVDPGQYLHSIRILTTTTAPSICSCPLRLDRHFFLQIRAHKFHGFTDSSRLYSNPMEQSHSSWSDFASTPSGAGSVPTSGHGARPRVGKDAFSDLLNDFGESASWQTHSDSQGPAKSINQMRREQLAKTTDPEQLKNSTPIADLLGIHSKIPDPVTNRSTPTPPPSTDQTGPLPGVLIDVDPGSIPSIGSHAHRRAPGGARIKGVVWHSRGCEVQDWAQGKSRNVRALLCSLPSILWDGVRWKPVSIADLITAEQVKRQYRNAARAIHPDKWRNTENEQLARMIFVELNDAMTEFEKDPGSTMSL